MAPDSRLDAFKSLARTAAPSVAVLCALLLTLGVAAALSGSHRATGNVNAQRYAAADIENVVWYAVVATVNSGHPAVLTGPRLRSAIDQDRQSATGASTHMVIVSIHQGRAVLSLDTPWQRHVCAWVPVRFAGPVNDWPVKFCGHG